ncbi:MAG: hypothetical protein AAF690_19620, partial [Acidobacteriota bacterium]
APDPGPVGSSSSTGPVVTKTLLIVGQGARTSRAGSDDAGKPVLRAFDKATGKVVAELELPGSPSGTPMTYVQDGKQYIAIAVSSPEAGIVALSLP